MAAKEIILKIKPGWLVFNYIIEILGIAGAAYMLYIIIPQFNYSFSHFFILIVFSGGGMALLFGIFVQHRHRLTLNMQGASKIGPISTEFIPYQELTEIRFTRWQNYAVVQDKPKGSEKILLISFMFTNKEEAIKFLLEKLEGIEGLKLLKYGKEIA